MHLCATAWAFGFIKFIDSMVHAHNRYLYFTACMLRSKWANILELVQCEIVNVISGDEIDAYMLRYVHVCSNGWIASYISFIHSHESIYNSKN